MGQKNRFFLIVICEIVRGIEVQWSRLFLEYFAMYACFCDIVQLRSWKLLQRVNWILIRFHIVHALGPDMFL